MASYRFSAKVGLASVALAGASFVTAVQPAHAAPDPLTCGPTTLEALPSHVALPAVKVPGGARPGSEITGATPAKIRSLAPAGVTFEISDIVWLVDGTRAGFGQTYTLRKQDLGKSVVQTAALTWSAPCRTHSLIATAPAVKVLASSKITVSRAASRGLAVKFKVTHPAATRVTGFVKVSWSGSRSGYRVLAVKGRTPTGTVALPGGSRGTVKVRAEFIDTSHRVANSTSNRLKLGGGRH